MRKFCCLPLFLAAMPAAALAAEVPAITVADFSGPETHWLWSFLASDAMSNAILSVLASAAAAVIGWFKWKDTRQGQAIMCLTWAVRETYEEYIRRIKHARADGKLTDDERKEAVQRAIDHGIAYAKQQGFDLLKVFAKSYLPVVIDGIVRRIKGESAERYRAFDETQPGAFHHRFARHFASGFMPIHSSST